MVNIHVNCIHMATIPLLPLYLSMMHSLLQSPALQAGSSCRREATFNQPLDLFLSLFLSSNVSRYDLEELGPLSLEKSWRPQGTYMWSMHLQSLNRYTYPVFPDNCLRTTFREPRSKSQV